MKKESIEITDNKNPGKLTIRQQRFIEEFCKDFNATQAAIRAFYSQRTAKQMGYENLRKPYIAEAIKKRLEELSLSSEEVIKLMSDIARSSLSDYFIISKVEKATRIEVSLKKVISDLKGKINFEEEYIELAKLNKKEKTIHQNMLKGMRRELIRNELEIKKNPKATRIINGPVKWIEIAELDIPRLVRDKEAGRIKSFKKTDQSVSVELYPADTALTALARIHGMFKDNLKLTAEDELMDLYKTVMRKHE